MQFINRQTEFLEGDGFSPFAIKSFQEIPQDFLDELRAQKNESSNRPMGEYHKAASIPVVVVEKWLREGYDISKEPIAKTIAKLKAESLDHFITTTKSL